MAKPTYVRINEWKHQATCAGCKKTYEEKHASDALYRLHRHEKTCVAYQAIKREYDKMERTNAT